MKEETRLLYSIPEASELLGIGKTTLYKQVRDGHISAVKMGMRTLITAQEIHNWIKNLPPANLGNFA